MLAVRVYLIYILLIIAALLKESHQQRIAKQMACQRLCGGMRPSRTYYYAPRRTSSGKHGSSKPGGLCNYAGGKCMAMESCGNNPWRQADCDRGREDICCMVH